MAAFVRVLRVGVSCRRGRGAGRPRAGAARASGGGADPFDSTPALLTNDASPYELLDVPVDATPQQIKASFRRMVKTFHPDVFPGTHVDEEGGVTVEEHFIKLQAAYELLMDEDQRREYDRSRRKHPMSASAAWRQWVERRKRAYEQRTDAAGAQWQAMQRMEYAKKAKQWQQAGDHDYERKMAVQYQRKVQRRNDTLMSRQALVMRQRDARAGARRPGGGSLLPSARQWLDALDAEEETPGAAGRRLLLLGDGSEGGAGWGPAREEEAELEEEEEEEEEEDLLEELEDFIGEDGDVDPMEVLRAQGFKIKE